MRVLLLIMLSIFIISPFSLAKEVKPGVVLTEDNYKEYLDGLRKITPESMLKRYIIPNFKKGLRIEVIKRVKTLPFKGRKEWAKKNNGVCKVTPDGKLINWVAGPPFLNPKSGIELAWNIQKTEWMEQGSYNPLRYFLFDKGGKIERKMDMLIDVMQFMGRTAVPPIPEIKPNPDKVWWKLNLLVTYPFDAKGFAVVRTRYIDPEKDDDIWGYLPTLRRIRRFTGADVQDPLFGSDYTQDDFAGWGQRLNPKIMEFKFLGEREILLPAQFDHEEATLKEFNPANGPFINTKWHLRKCYLLDIEIKDPTYMYSKRRFYLDKEIGNFNVLYEECFDQRGRLWRTQMAHNYSLPDREVWNGVIWPIWDYQSGHATIIKMVKPKMIDTSLRPESFILRNLIRRAR